MRQVTRKGLVTVAAAGGVLALGGGYAQADSGANGGASNSPGVLSGNSVQAPVHVPVNACGNTVNVVGLLNPAMGNKCANVSRGTGGGGGGGSHADGGTSNSPGVGSGNSVQVPIDLPVNACGNSVTIGGLLNPSFGNDCENGPDTPTPPGKPGTPEEPETPETPVTPEKPGEPGTPNTPGTQTVTPPEEHLAATGAGALGVAAPVGAGLLLAGAVLYRKARRAA
ncbi:chaplin [Streptomyces sp. NPDC005805]|uniref:chaplin n=1 Tax=Streptomyces sp. NPDC005805 TaxID=3157068 RepID=UPI0033C17DA5